MDNIFKAIKLLVGQEVAVALSVPWQVGKYKRTFRCKIESVDDDKLVFVEEIQSYGKIVVILSLLSVASISVYSGGPPFAKITVYIEEE